MEATNLDTVYGSPLLDWRGVESRLDKEITQAPGTGGPDRHTCWLATINRDGSPDGTGVGALWVDGTFWFETVGSHNEEALRRSSSLALASGVPRRHRPLLSPVSPLPNCVGLHSAS